MGTCCVGRERAEDVALATAALRDTAATAAPRVSVQKRVHWQHAEDGAIVAAAPKDTEEDKDDDKLALLEEEDAATWSCAPVELRSVGEEKLDFRSKSLDMYREDRIEHIKNVFIGHLLHKKHADCERIDLRDDGSPSSGSPSSGSKSVNDRWRAAVRKVGSVAGKRNVRKSRCVSSDDVQVLMLESKQWLEAADAKHRAGGNLKEYFKIWKESSTAEAFFHWLDHGEGQDLDLKECRRCILETSHVKYCTIVERQSYVVVVQDGALRYEQNSSLVHGKPIFVMGLKGHLYMREKERGRFHHSSFLAGNPVLVAGYAEVEHGRFVKLFPFSGHYRPQTEDFHEFVRQMRNQGLAEDQCELLSQEIEHPDFHDKSVRKGKKVKKDEHNEDMNTAMPVGLNDNDTHDDLKRSTTI